MLKVLENDPRFYIKNSTLPGAGLGLFAKQPLKQGQWLEIIGVMVERNTAADQCTAFANEYKFGSKYDEEIWHIIPLGYAAIINQANTKGQQNCEIRNIKAKVTNKKIKSNKDFFAYSGEAVYLFIRDIQKDEELLGNYGREWKKQEEWINQYNKVFTETEEDWKKFISYDLYNMPIIKNRIPLLGDINVPHNARNTVDSFRDKSGND